MRKTSIYCFADSVKRELDYTNLRRKHSWSVSYILCVGIVGVVVGNTNATDTLIQGSSNTRNVY